MTAAPPRLFSGTFLALMASSLVLFIAGGLILPVAPRFARDELIVSGAVAAFGLIVIAVAALATPPTPRLATE